MQHDHIKIAKEYVHKIKDDNVFLCNLRRILPLTISKDFFENNICKAVDQNEFEYLSMFYCLYTPARGTSAESAPEEVYALRYLPTIHFLSPEQYESLLAAKTTLWEKELFASFYIHENHGRDRYFRLKNDLTEPQDNFLVVSLKAWDQYINVEERSKIASILEKIPEMPLKEIYFSNMFVNVEHLFFFEHPNDHVPGMMLIETIRQFIVACGHVYGRIPMEGTQLILNNLDCQFMSYININYPIVLKGTVTDYKFTREGHWQNVTLQVEVIQNNKISAIVNLKGTCISSRLFSRIRRNQIAEMRHTRFIPYNNNKYTLELLPSAGKSPIKVNMVNLSMEGISIRITDDKSFPDHDIYQITLSHADHYKITGKYKKIWQNSNSGCTVIGLSIMEAAEQDLERLNNLITRDFIAVEERELN